MNWSEWLRKFDLNRYSFIDPNQLKSVLALLYIQDQDANKLCTSPLILSNGQISLQALES